MSSYLKSDRRRDPHFDGRWRGSHGDVLVEIKRTSNIRDIRGAMLGLAYALSEDASAAKALCVVVNSKLSAGRLDAELAQFRLLIQRDLSHRIIVSSLEQLKQADIDASLAPRASFVSWLLELIDREATEGRVTKQTVVAALATTWLRNKTPMTAKLMQQLFGASYPTVVSAVSDFDERGLVESTTRGTMLRYVPPDLWMQIAEKQMQSRKTHRFYDPPGLSRSPQALMKRLAKLWTKDKAQGVAVGGVLGALHYFPDLDITGSPRLDLSVYGILEASLVQQLDAALIPAGPKDRPDLVVHVTAEPWALMHNVGQIRWASEMECTADLIELNLIGEAQEMASRILSQSNHKPNSPDDHFRCHTAALAKRSPPLGCGRTA